jgi:hypothetical protein
MSFDEISLDHITRTITPTGEAEDWAYNGFIYLEGQLIASDHGATPGVVEEKQRRYVDHLLSKYDG